MLWGFASYGRKGAMRDINTLQSVTIWLKAWGPERDAAFAERFIDTIYHRKNWGPVACFADTQDRPHIMLVMRHDMDQPEEELLRGKTLAILAAIITRTGNLYEEGHVYIPVLVFSSMGNLKGKIIQAYLDGFALRVGSRKSAIFNI